MVDKTKKIRLVVCQHRHKTSSSYAPLHWHPDPKWNCDQRNQVDSLNSFVASLFWTFWPWVETRVFHFISPGEDSSSRCWRLLASLFWVCRVWLEIKSCDSSLHLLDGHILAAGSWLVTWPCRMTLLIIESQFVVHYIHFYLDKSRRNHVSCWLEQVCCHTHFRLMWVIQDGYPGNKDMVMLTSHYCNLLMFPVNICAFHLISLLISRLCAGPICIYIFIWIFFVY